MEELCGATLAEKSEITPVWATAMGTVHEAIIMSLIGDSEVAIQDKRKKLELTFAKLEKISKQAKVNIQQHMSAAIIGKASQMISTLV